MPVFVAFLSLTNPGTCGALPVLIVTGPDLLQKITTIRSEQVELTRFVRSLDERVSLRLRFCGSWLHYREFHAHEDQIRLLGANFCKNHLLCKACAARRSVKLVRAYAAKFRAVLAAAHPADPCLGPPAPPLYAYMATFTIRNGASLTERVDHLRSSWNRQLAAVRRHKSCPRRHPSVEWGHVYASVRAIEIKRGKGSGMWHPHIHAYFLSPRPLDACALRAEWKRWTGDSHVLHLRPCSSTDPIGALCEVLKYTLKPGSFTHHDLWRAYSTLGGQHFVDASGAARGVPPQDLDSDDLDLDGPSTDYVATWLWMQQQYHVQSGPDVSQNTCITFLPPGN